MYVLGDELWPARRVSVQFVCGLRLSPRTALLSELSLKYGGCKTC